MRNHFDMSLNLPQKYTHIARFDPTHQQSFTPLHEYQGEHATLFKDLVATATTKEFEVKICLLNQYVLPPKDVQKVVQATSSSCQDAKTSGCSIHNNQSMGAIVPSHNSPSISTLRLPSLSI